MKPVGPPKRPSLTASSPASPLDTALIFGHGTFQRLAMLCSMLSVFVSLSHSVAIVVFSRPVEHWCKPPPQYADTPTDVWKNQSIPVKADGTFSSCIRYEPPLETGNITRNRTVVPCDAWDYNLPSREQSIVSKWDLVCDRRWLLLVQPAIYFGGSVSTSVTGYIGDRVGRKPVFHGALFLLIASGTATMFSRTVVTFSVLRFLTSASAFTVINMASVLLFEVTETAHRVVFSTFASSCATMMLPLLQLLLFTVTRHWVVSQAVVMGLTYLLLLSAYFIEESPSWLLAIGDLEGTERAVLWAANINGLPLDDVKARMKNIKHQRLRRGSMKTEADSASVFDLAFNNSLRYRAVVIFACTCILILHYYDTFLGKIMTESALVRIIYIVVRIPLTIAFIFILHHLSRRRVLCFTMILMSVLVGFQAWLVQKNDDSFVLVETVILEAIILDAAVMTALLYAMEIFPTVLRVTGVSLNTMFASLGTMLTPFIKEPGPRIDRTLALTVSSAAFILIGLAVLQLPETTEVSATNTIREAELEAKWQSRAPDEMALRNSRFLGASRRS